VGVLEMFAGMLLAGTTLKPDAIVLASPLLPVSSTFAGSEPPPAQVGTAHPPVLAAPALLPPSVLPPVPPKVADTDQNDILVIARRHAAAGDPLEALNTKSFAATQAVDRAVFGPVALAYAHAIPSPIRSGLRNFLNNLHEPDVFLNYLLQLKPGKAAETFGRFAINSTIGGAGVFDIPKRRPFTLPRRPNGFSDSLGFYGVKSGPFFFLPLIGPTTLRDLVGNVLDRLVLPLAVGGPFKRPFFTTPVSVLSALDRRAEFDEKLHDLRDGTADPYTASRAFYLQKRQAEVDGLHRR
jgi:phospholipid-binding lipoprotein MlaA